MAKYSPILYGFKKEIISYGIIKTISSKNDNYDNLCNGIN